MLHTRFTTPMRCPACRHPLAAMKTKEETHVDPTGHGVYLCINSKCPRLNGDIVIYRRVIREVEEHKKIINQATDATRAEQVRQFHIQTERLNELTKWIRNHQPGLLDGRFKDQVDAAIYIMEKGKGGQSGS